MKTINSQSGVLLLLADENLRLSVSDGKARIVRRDAIQPHRNPIARVKNGLPSKLRDNGFMVYDGAYELTEKGKAQAAKLNADAEEILRRTPQDGHRSPTRESREGTA